MCVCVRVFGGAPWHIVTPATGVRSAGARWCDLMLSGNLAYQCHNGSFHFNLCECVRACAERRNDSFESLVRESGFQVTRATRIISDLVIQGSQKAQCVKC